jgi:predicted dehydrogenase
MGAWLEGYEAPDHAYAHLDHANGAHTMVEISYSYNHTSAEPLHLYTYDLIGKDGVIRYDRAEECVEVRNTSGTERYPVHGGKNFISMYRAFAKAVEQGEPGDLASALDGLIATRITRLAVEEAVERRLAPSH